MQFLSIHYIAQNTRISACICNLMKRQLFICSNRCIHFYELLNLHRVPFWSSEKRERIWSSFEKWSVIKNLCILYIFYIIDAFVINFCTMVNLCIFYIIDRINQALRNLELYCGIKFLVSIFSVGRRINRRYGRVARETFISRWIARRQNHTF